jgi:two-component system, OmpR family, sensor histidine kinase KdpD
VKENKPVPKTPEEWLAVTTPPVKTKGILKLFLGYAPGVGKTFSMLSEAIRRHSRGEDIVIGVVETHGRKGIAELVPQLEVVPRRKIEYKGTVFEEMDVDAIIARRPQVALVDELAHTNIPGSKHRKRYEDVLEILEATIDVISTVNIQHIESIAPTVNAITGIVVRETVPDWVLQLSEETVMVDLTPEALHNRMRRGDIYRQEKVEQSLTNFFRRGNLIALRELALRQVAEQVDRSLSSYMDEKDIKENWAVRERIAVCISSNPRAQYLLARAARMARRMDAELFAVHVDIGDSSNGRDEKSLEANMQFAESLGAKAVRLKGKSVPDAAAQFVREKHVTQMIFGRTAVEGWRKLLYMNAINRFLRDAPAVDVHIVTQEPD